MKLYPISWKPHLTIINTVLIIGGISLKKNKHSKKNQEIL